MMDASDINHGGAYTPDDEDLGECSTCGQLLAYDTCEGCAGSGWRDDGRCQECDGGGEVLVCDCYYEAIARAAEEHG